VESHRGIAILDTCPVSTRPANSTAEHSLLAVPTHKIAGFERNARSRTPQRIAGVAAMAAAADLELPSHVNGAGETRLCHTGVLLRTQRRPAPRLVLPCARSMRTCGSCTQSGMASRRGGEQGWRRATLLEKSCCLVCAMSMRSSITSSESSMNGSVKSQYSVPKFFFSFCMRDVVEAMSTQRSRCVFAPSWPSCHHLRRCPSLIPACRHRRSCSRTASRPWVAMPVVVRSPWRAQPYPLYSCWDRQAVFPVVSSARGW